MVWNIALTRMKYLAYWALLYSSSPGLAIQPSAPDAIPAPIRDLQWGQLNFLHTIDTHGWLAGHLQEYGFAIYCAIVDAR